MDDFWKWGLNVKKYINRNISIRCDFHHDFISCNGRIVIMAKFGAIRSEASCGRSFASKGERDCYEYLKIFEKMGEITDLQCQVTTPLTAGITHRTDFRYFDVKKGETVWAEYKGIVDQRWRDIKKLWRFYGPGKLKVYSGYGSRIKLMDEIIPEGL